MVARASTRRSSKNTGVHETPRILSPEEKHRLILAHASMRKPKDPVQRVTMWAGLTIAVMAIVGGWWVTVGSQVRQRLQISDGEFASMAERLDAFADSVNTDGDVRSPALSDPTPSAQASEFGDLIQAVLEGSQDENYDRNDLLAPKAIRNTSSTSERADGMDADADEDFEDSPYLIDPDVPGLAPSY